VPALEEFTAAYRAGDVVFFAGAGASFDSKAAMPPAVLSASAELFLPDDPALARLVEEVLQGSGVAGTALRGIQPEIFYEHLLSLCDDRQALALWRILSPRWLKTQNAALAPNANHLALADYAARTGLPIFTTNFDMLFEAAATQLGLPAEVVLPPPNAFGPEIDPAPAPGRMRLFKLHGSIALAGVERLDSLQTTMQGIAAVNRPMLDLIERVSRGRALVFLGYSGCDIDYFPVLAGLTLDRRPFWFNLGEEPVTRSHAQRIGAREIGDFPSKVFADLHPQFPASAPGPDSGLLLQRLKAEVSVRLTAGQKTLLLAQCLQSMGRSPQAAEILETLDPEAAGLAPADQAAALLLRARIQDCTSQYRQSVDSAEAALRAIGDAVAAGSIDAAEAAALEARALYHRAMARQQQIGPSIRYRDARLDWRPGLGDMLTQLASGVVLWLRLATIGKRLARAGKNQPRLAFIRAEHAINDHAMMLLGRIISLLEAFKLQRLPLMTGMLTRLVGGLLERASRTGDYFVYASARKYQRRLRGIDGVDEASETYGLLRDPLNYAIVRRDAGVRYLEQGDRTRAAEEFCSAVDAGLACGSRATALKGLVGLARCGALTSDDVHVLETVGPAIEGAGYERYWASRVLPFLASLRAASSTGATSPAGQVDT
jgi:hypothetical protein